MDEDMKINCPACKGVINVDDLSKTGKPFTIRCPNCGNQVSGGFGTILITEHLE